MCKVYTDVGGLKYLYHVCPLVHVRKIIHNSKAHGVSPRIDGPPIVLIRAFSVV